MTVAFQLLARTALGEPEAANQLGHWLMTFGIDPRAHDPDEVRQRVAVKVLTDARRIVTRLLGAERSLHAHAATPDQVAELDPGQLAAVEGRLRGYVRSMARNTAVSVWRIAQRGVSAEEPDLDALASSEADPVQALTVRESVVAWLALRDGLRESVQQDIDEMEALQDGVLEMAWLVRRDLEDRDLDPSDPVNRRGSRDRICRRHGRTRQRVAQAVSALDSRGKLPPGVGDQMLSWIHSLRRRVPKPRSVSAADADL